MAPADPAAPDANGSTRRRVILGRITGVFGVKGWVKVHSDTVPRENILDFSEWQLGRRGQWNSVEVKAGKPQGKTLIAQLAGVSTPEQGRLLLGASIAVWRDQLPPAAEGEYYWTDLIGLSVETLEHGRLGRVKRLFETGANDVLVVVDERDGAKPGQEVLVPWVAPDVVVRVDVQEKVIVIDWDPDF